MTKKNDNGSLTAEHMRLLQKRLYNHVMERLEEPEPPAAVLQTAFKMIDGARLDLDTGETHLDNMIEALPPEFKESLAQGKPEWTQRCDDEGDE